MINLNLNSSNNYNFNQSVNTKLPSITVADLQYLQKQSVLFPYKEEKIEDKQYLLNKFITKAAVVISTVISANHLTPNVYKYSKSFGEKLKSGSFKYQSLLQ